MTAQPEAHLEAELVAQLGGMGYGYVTLAAKVAGVVGGVAAAQR